MWKEAVVAKFTVGKLSQHFLGVTEETHKRNNQDNRSPGRDLNLRPL
jgi:hypothetical protein